MKFLAWIRKIHHALHECAESIRNTESRPKEQYLPPDKPVEVHAVVSYDKLTVADTSAQNERQHATQESIKKATWAGFAAVAIYAFITACMWREMIKATKYAKISADAIQAQVTEARRATVVGQRAFISLKSQMDVDNCCVPDTDPVKGLNWAVRPRIENSGNTAALNLMTSTNINSPDYAKFPNGFDYADRTYKKGTFPNSEIRQGGGILGAHEDGGLVKIGVPLAALEGVNHGKKHVYLWGSAKYDDVFGCGHIMRFCREIIQAAPPHDMEWDACSKNNCADKTCEGYHPTNKPLCLEAEAN